MPSFWFAWKKALRTLGRERKKTFALVFILTLIFGIGSLFNDIFATRENNFNHVLTKTDMAQGLINIEFTPVSVLDPILAAEGEDWLENHENRLYFLSDFTFSTGESKQGILLGINMSRTSHLNTVVYANGTGYVLPDNTFGYGFSATHPDIPLDSRISISYGAREFDYPIEHVGFNPEWYYYPVSSLGNSFSFGNPPVFYHNLTGLCGDLGIPVGVNQILFNLHEGKEFEDFEDSITAKLTSAGIRVEGIVPFEDMTGIATALMEIENSDSLGPVIIGFFFIFGMIITLVLVHRLVDEDVKQLGVYQSIGIYESEMHLAYAFYILLVMGLSLAVGLVGRLVLGTFILQAQFQTLGVPMLVSLVPLPLMTLGVLLAMTGATLVVNTLVIHSALRSESTEIIHRETRYLKKPSLLERLVVKLRKHRAHPFSKYSIRRVFMRKGLLVTTLGTIIFAQMSLYAGLGMLQMWDDLGVYKYQTIERWDGYALTWEAGGNGDLLDRVSTIPGIDRAETGFLGKSELVLPDQNLSVSLIAFEENTQLHEFKIRSGNQLSKSGEILISEDLVSKFGVKRGDTIQLKPPVYSPVDSASHILEFKIIGISADTQANAVYLTLEDAAALVGVDPVFNIIYFAFSDSAQAGDHKEIIQTLENMDSVAQVIDKENALVQMDELIENFAFLYSVIGAGIVLLSFAAIFLIMKSHLSDRLEDYLNLKALGMHNREIWKKVNLEMLFFLVVSIPFGIIFADLLAEFLSGFFREFSPGVSVFIGWKLDVIVPLITAGIAFLGATMALSGLNKRSVEDVTRKKEFG